MKIASNRISDIVRFFREELKDVYEKQELETVIAWCFEAFLGLDRTRLLLKMQDTVSESELLKFSFAVKDLKTHKPIQYVLGEADFYGMKLSVNSSVLIPRPETEELVDHIIKENRTRENFRILDIGTGSGCIAIALAKNLPHAVVSAMDVSGQALETARANAKRNDVEVKFIQQDILAADSLSETYDLIVSNPPYVRFSEREQMKENVLEHEPHLALFVKDEDPLLFYRVIAGLALKTLKENGSIWFELNASFGPETQEMLVSKGFKNVKLIKDLSNNYRILRGNI
jgi:release factor glutamine methyltransferase